LSLADRYDAFLLDLDGVVWRGEQVIPGADDAVARLRELGRRVVFVTNNSSRAPRDYAIKLARMKIPTPPDDVVTSGHVVIKELRRIGVEPGDVVHVCGGEGLIRLIMHERIQTTAEETGPIKAVVVGWNPRGTFEDIRKAANLVRAGVPFIASNTDATYPSAGQLLPGTGAIVAAIEVASGRTCTYVGKPKPDLFQLALERAGSPSGRAVFIGDRPETDIVGATGAGLECALVLTGVVSEGDLGSLPALPTWILNDLAEVTRDLPMPRIERRDGALAAVEGEADAGSIGVSDGGGTRILNELRLSARLDPEAGWRVARQLLAEAVWGAEHLFASADVRRQLERIGVHAGSSEDAQGVLPGL
jgi:HAD superfamily hydrolase (TIGR01450 family)